MEKTKNILNTPLNLDKKFYLEIQKIYGIGSKNALFICNKFGISKNILVRDLKNNLVLKLENYITMDRSFLLQTDLSKFEYESIKNLQDIKSYRGFRHLYKLSARGQRTKTNCKTQKNRRKRKKNVKKKN